MAFQERQRHRVREEAKLLDRLWRAARGPARSKGQSGKPRGPRGKNPSPLLAVALNDPVYARIDGDP